MPDSKKRSRPAKKSTLPKGRPKAAAASGVDLSLYFSGLCAFVPHKVTVGGVQVQHMKVVLVDAESPELTIHDAIHSAVLVVAKDRVASSPRDYDFWFNGIPNFSPIRDMVGFLLREEDLQIVELDITKPIDPATGTPGECPTEPPPFYFDWIQRMPVGFTKMSKNAFSLTYNDVMARIDLYDGQLSTSGWPFEHTHTKLLKWYLDTEMGGGTVTSKRAIAEVIKFSRQLPSAATVTFRSPNHKDIVLRPDPNDPNGYVNAWIFNLPLIDVLVNRSLGATKDRGPEHHFMNFYRLAPVPPGDLIPWPKSDPPLCDPPASGAANPRCPPVLFADGVA